MLNTRVNEVRFAVNLPAEVFMSVVIFFFGSGLAFYVGLGLILLAVLFAMLRTARFLPRMAPVTAILGMILVGLSAVPLPYWFYAAAGVITLCWLVIEHRQSSGPAFTGLLRAVIVGECVAAAAMELPYDLNPTITVKNQPALWIIGDSVSTGAGDHRMETWPNILARKHGIAVRDLSQTGANVATALQLVKKMSLGDGIVLLEIGGNDLLGTTKAADYEQQLDSLLTQVCKPGRTVLMFELPLPPFCNDYGSVQRQLAARHRVTLIPKRYFVEVLTAGDATLDSIHLTQPGHEVMADMVWRIVVPAITK